jgi:PAS domain S-box-containing protein
MDDGRSVVVGHAQDVTAAVEAQKNMRESMRQFRFLFEEAPVAYHEMDKHGILVRVNRAECQLLGYRKEEILGQPAWRFLAPEMREASQTSIKLKIGLQKPLSPSFVREFLTKDERRLSLEIHERLIQTSSGEVVGMRAALLDVTEQFRIEAELRQLNEELDRRVAKRTEELYASNQRMKEFVYTVSHDLQEPLRSISAFASLLKERHSSALDADGAAFLEYVIEGSDRMRSLVADLLKYAWALSESYTAEPVALNSACDVALRNLGDAVRDSNAAMERCDLPVIVGNPHRMVQLFQNLLSNAIKYRGDEPLRVRIAAGRCPLGWRITVADNGCGVPEAQRTSIFGLFKRGTDARAEGAGVGLAICKAIVERHGGALWVDETPGGGASFHFTLPAQQDA